MSILFYFLIAYFFILFGYLITLILLLTNLKKDKTPDTYTSYPFISILIAARNEEDNIIACLEAIAALSWPTDKLEVLIGNDLSTDQTEMLVLDFIKDKNNFHLITITQTIGEAKGKANVLAHLTLKAKGAFFFFTDADIQVPKKWIQSLLANHEENMGIVSGVTKTGGNSLFQYCQRLDWIYAFGMIKVASEHNIPVSAVGNNMMISRKAYESTGGYAKIPFSVTEDLQLFLESLKKGWKYKNLMSSDSLAVSKPVESFLKLLSQRKRWTKGAMKLPAVLLLFLFVQALFVPVILTTIFIFPILGLSFWVLKILLQQCCVFISFRKIREEYSVWKGFLAYEIYSGLFSIMVLLVSFIPTKVKWKGREY
jgi:cellulose synthase/poly-beta-1,6-N-acetylglucosamine synthase-like glycosyltransferase